MKSSTTILVLAMALLITGLGAGAAWSADGMAVVDSRQALMKQQGKDAGAVKNYLDGKDGADLASAAAAAADLAQTTRTIPDRFPPDTGMAQFPGKSGAKPAIWTDWNTFLADQQAAVAKADVLLVAVKSGDKPAIAAAFGDLGKNGCGNCHTAFREKVEH